VAETLDNEKRPESQPATRPRASSRTPAIVVSSTFFALAFVSAATAYALSSFNRAAEQSPRETASAPIPDPAVSATLRDIQSAQQQNAAALERLTRGVADQQANLKRISDQLSSLLAQVNNLQDAPVWTSSISQPIVRARVAATSRKKVSPLPKPFGPVSVGGAPLSPVID
jgi:uncharacterized coiled-coil protein SlyX